MLPRYYFALFARRCFASAFAFFRFAAADVSMSVYAMPSHARFLPSLLPLFAIFHYVYAVFAPFFRFIAYHGIDAICIAATLRRILMPC